MGKESEKKRKSTNSALSFPSVFIQSTSFKDTEMKKELVQLKE